MSNLPRTIAKPGESTAAGQQHQAHPPSLERRADLGASVPEGVPDRLGTQHGRPGPVKVDVDGAVAAAADVLADALADVSWRSPSAAAGQNRHRHDRQGGAVPAG